MIPAADAPDSTPNASEFLRQVDEDLSPLLEPLRMATQTSRPTVALRLWDTWPAISLLPFHLHLRWPDAIESLSLFADISMVPFTASDVETAESYHLYEAGEAHQRRARARWARYTERRGVKDDYFFADWEDCIKRRPELRSLTLSPMSFVAIDRVSATGIIRHGARPRLGRYCGRGEPRPRLLVPGLRGIAPDAVEVLAEADLLIVNLQGLRGRRTVQGIRSVMEARGEYRPTLLIASSPRDLLLLDLEDVQQFPHFVTGDVPVPRELKVSLVGADRALIESLYEFASEDLQVRSAEGTRTLVLAKAAWWAARQSLGTTLEDLPEFDRFFSALDALKASSPHEAQLFGGIEDVLNRYATDEELATERRRAVLDAVLEAEGVGGVLVLARNAASTRLLRREIADDLGVSLRELEGLDVSVRTPFGLLPEDTPSAVVLTGYFGRASLDAVLASRAPRIHFVMDPVEVRAAEYGLRESSKYLEAVGEGLASRALHPILEELREHTPPDGTTIAVDLEVQTWISTGDSPLGDLQSAPPGEALVQFTDGSSLAVRVNARLDVLPQGQRRFKSQPIPEILPGDRVVVLDEEDRRSFSARLMEVLDAGTLRREAQERQLWGTIVQAVVSQRRPNMKEIQRRLNLIGEQVSYDTVRAWCRSSEETRLASPRRISAFLAFAELLGVSLPELRLMEMFQAIRRWRIMHMQAGRRLARVIRAAYMNRLDAVTLARIEREWGFEVRQLLEAAHVGVVDEIHLPEGWQDAAN